MIRKLITRKVLIDRMDLRIAMPVRGTPRQRTLPQRETLEVAHDQLRHRARGQRLGPH